MTAARFAPRFILPLFLVVNVVLSVLWGHLSHRAVASSKAHRPWRARERALQSVRGHPSPVATVGVVAPRGAPRRPHLSLVDVDRGFFLRLWRLGEKGLRSSTTKTRKARMYTVTMRRRRSISFYHSSSAFSQLFVFFTFFKTPLFILEINDMQIYSKHTPFFLLRCKFLQLWWRRKAPPYSLRNKVFRERKRVYSFPS